MPKRDIVQKRRQELYSLRGSIVSAAAVALLDAHEPPEGSWTIGNLAARHHHIISCRGNGYSNDVCKPVARPDGRQFPCPKPSVQRAL